MGGLEYEEERMGIGIQKQKTQIFTWVYFDIKKFLLEIAKPRSKRPLLYQYFNFFDCLINVLNKIGKVRVKFFLESC